MSINHDVNVGIVKAQRPFAVFDIDGTLIRWQLFHAVTDALAQLGYLNSTDYNHIRSARREWKMRLHPDSFKTYEDVMIRGFEKIITKLSVEQFTSAVDKVIGEYKDQIYIFSKDLIKELKSRNYILFAISGSQNELVSRIASYYGFHDYVGTEYIKKAGKFTGEKIFYAHDKKAVLDRLIQKHGVTTRGSVGIGDSSSDIPMLEMVERPIAFNPEKKLYDIARESGWSIVVERKNIFYKLEPKDGTYVLV
jgi:HAD superfamily hydrolase (TIGR01490 family)